MPGPKEETSRCFEAFEYYYALGENRSLSKVAQQFKVSVPAVANWSKAFNWWRRVQERNREIAGRVAEKVKIDLVEMTDRQLRIARAVQGVFARRLTDKELKPDARDFINAANLERELLGYAPDGATKQQDIAEMLRMLTYVLHSKLPDSCPHCHTLLNLKGEVAAELLALSKKFASESEPEPTTEGLGAPELPPAPPAQGT